MKIVCDLVGIDPDQGPLDLVDGSIEGLKRNGTEFIGKRALQRRIKMPPKPAAAADDVFPQAGLAFMHPGGCPLASGVPSSGGAYALLVERMTGLVQRRK